MIFLYFNETKKNCFIYIALAKYCCIIKLGEFKSYSKILCQINQEILKATKFICNSSKAFQLMYPQLVRICRGRCTGCFIYSFVIQMISKETVQQKFYQQFERYFYMTIIVTIIPTELVTNLLLSAFCSFLQTKSKNQVFSKSVFKVFSCALRQSYAEFNGLL